MKLEAQPGPQTLFASCPADVAFFASSPGSGKLLPVDTPIPTPRGWSLIRSLTPGDVVFDMRGDMCVVTGVYATETPVVTYRIHFDDRTSMVCASTHLWVTQTDLERKARKPVAVRTTQEIVDTLYRKDGGSNHSIPVSGALQMPTTPLPLDPYVFGLWLGDGSGGMGAITTMDPEVVESVTSAGYPVQHQSTKPNNAASTYTFAGLRAVLASMGVLIRYKKPTGERPRRTDTVYNGKHIPTSYLRAGEEQRWELLRGIVDSDGYICPKKRTVEICCTYPRLARDIHELTLSLGLKSTCSEGVARLNGREIGPKWRICFHSHVLPCRLTRKAAAWKPRSRPTTYNRYITGAERVESVEMCCISVNSPDHTYLAGRDMIPTHNSFALVMETLRWVHLPNYTGVLLRQNHKELTRGPSSLFGMLANFGPLMGGRVRQAPYPGAEFKTAGGSSSVLCMHGNSAKSTYDGIEIALSCWDEADHFDLDLWQYVTGSRARTTCGIKPYVRCSTMPSSSSWVRDMVTPWLDVHSDSEAFPGTNQSGVVRWFYHDDRGVPQIFDSEGDAQDAARAVDPGLKPRSLSFIFACTTDNKVLMRADPAYLDRLSSLSPYERQRLLYQNWNVRPSSAGMFDRACWQVRERPPVPKEIRESVRGWDLAATKPSEINSDPDWTRGARLDVLLDGTVCVSDMVSMRDRPGPVDDLIRATARQDGPRVVQAFARDPGSAGVRDEQHIRDLLSKVTGCGPVRVQPAANKVALAKVWSAVLSAGQMSYCRASWNGPFLSELDAFPGKGHDDQVDAVSYAFRELRGVGRGLTAAEKLLGSI